jgi:Ni2+-binding GTPase involved in maturation of urease and hydrogenase
MKNLIVKPIPIPSGATHAEPPHSVLPKHEFSMGFIAPKGSGKTTALINLIDFYKGYFNKIIIFSPTVKNDEKWVNYFTNYRIGSKKDHS